MHELLAETLRRPYGCALVIAPARQLRTMRRRILARLGALVTKQFETTVNCAGGGYIDFCSAENVESARGCSYDLALVVDLPARLEQTVVSEVVRPALRERRGGLVQTSRIDLLA